ncbi:hypothetical protein [Microlunatus endophyticus]
MIRAVERHVPDAQPGPPRGVLLGGLGFTASFLAACGNDARTAGASNPPSSRKANFP